jgi:hypothetical protein
MDEFEFQGTDEFSINYKEVAEATDLIAPIRLLAIDLQKNPYLSLGDWFMSLSSGAFNEINELVELNHEIEDEEDQTKMEVIEQLGLLTMMLARAEGIEGNTMEEFSEQINVFCNTVTCVSLARKGVVKVYYENLSLGKDMSEKVIVEKL